MMPREGMCPREFQDGADICARRRVEPSGAVSGRSNDMENRSGYCTVNGWSAPAPYFRADEHVRFETIDP